MSTEGEKPEATELEWLQFFYKQADFGPADGDVKQIIREHFEKKTQKRVPKAYRDDDDE